MSNEKPNPMRQDLGYDLPLGKMTLDEAKALVAMGSTSPEAARLVARENDIAEDDLRNYSDSFSPPLTPEQVKKSHEGYLKATEVLKEELEKRRGT